MSSKVIRYNKDRFNEWLQTLRTTDLPQADGYLVKNIDIDFDGDQTVLGYCCLGIACTLVPHLDDSKYLDPINEIGLAPGEVLQWLEVTTEVDYESEDYDGVEWDLIPDFPPDLRERNPHDGRAEGSLLLHQCTAASMNDSGFTFEQIADVFAYFGLGGVQ